MRRTGTVQLKSQEEPLSVVLSSGDYLRIDVLEDISYYNPIDTTNCIAAYIRSNNGEFVSGNESIIRSILKIKHEASMMNATEQKSIEKVDGKVRMVRTKELPDLGLSYKIVMEKARNVEEFYQTPDGTISITTVDTTDESLFVPLNFKNTYNPLGTFGGKTQRAGGAEYYSEEDLLKMYPQVRHVLDEDYVVIQSYEEALERLNIWINSKEQLKTFDIESLHEKWGIFSDNKITGVFLGFGEHWSTYFPFRQDNFQYNLPIEFLYTIFEAIRDQPPAPEVIILAYNSLFELEGFYQEYRQLVRVDCDPYLLAVLCNPKIQKGTHTLKAVAGAIDDKFYLSLKHIFIGKVKFNVLPPGIVKLYGCPDATSPAKVYKYLMKKLPKDELWVLNLEHQLRPVKVMNEFYGLPMIMERVKRLIEEEEYKVNLLSDIFRKIHKTSRNINSYQVMKEILYDKLRCPVNVLTKKGLPATSKVAIDTIVRDGTLTEWDKDNMPKPILDMNGKVLVSSEELASNKYPSLVIYQKYKKCTKELGALRRLRDHSDKDRFMFYINQVGAGSNRQTSDAHQFSDTMKSCVCSDSKQHGLVSCDYSQVELRVLAWLAGEKPLIKLESDPRVDIHRAVLSIIKKKPMYLISDKERKDGKRVNFGVVYMMTEYGLASGQFGPKYTKDQLNQMRQSITDFFNGLPCVKKYLADNEVFLRENGFIKTKFNYYRPFPELLDPTVSEKVKKTLIRAGNNTPVQGTAAQMMKMTEVNIWNYIKEKGWDKEKDYGGIMLPMVRMMLPIHDEVLLSYDESIPKEEIIKMFKICMEHDFEGAPPFYASPAFIGNWLDGKNAKYEIDIPLRDKIVEEYDKGNCMLTGHDYVEVLTNYREGELRDYMEGLIKKYKTPEVVAENVKDDNLTHVLIKTMAADHPEIDKMDHEEKIKKATACYFETLENKGRLNIIVDDSDKIDDDYSDLMEVSEWTEAYAHIDQYGDLVIDNEEEWEEENNIIYAEDAFKGEVDILNKPHALYIMQEVWVDITGMDIKGNGDAIYQGLKAMHDPEAYYNVILVMGKRTIPTGIKIHHDMAAIEKLFEQAQKGVG